jgi:hypothetical protein
MVASGADRGELWAWLLAFKPAGMPSGRKAQIAEARTMPSRSAARWRKSERKIALM